MHRRKSLLRVLARDRRGSVLPIAAMALGLGLGMGSIAVDLGRMSTEQNKLKIMSQMVALAAIQELPDEASARSEGMRLARRNGDLMRFSIFGSDQMASDLIVSTDIDFGSWDGPNGTFDAAASPADAVRVRAYRINARSNALRTIFARLLGFATLEIQAETIVSRRAGNCILALEPSDQDAIKLGGATTVNAPDCSIQVNSTSHKALKVASDAHAVAAPICVVGGIYSHPENVAAYAETDCPAVADPLAGLPAPGTSPCTANAVKIDGGVHTLNPGVYCNGISIADASVVFNPGVYVIADKSFLIDGGSTVSGSGVFFYLQHEKSLLEFKEPASITLSAPTSGQWAGVLFYQERTVKPGEHKIDDDGNKVFAGTMYFPASQLTYKLTGTGSSVGVTGSLIARLFEFSNKGTLLISPGSGKSSRWGVVCCS